MPYTFNPFTNNFDFYDTSGGGGGDVSGPGSSTDNAVVRWDGATGTLIQNSTVIISDAGDITANSIDLTTPLAANDGGTGLSSYTTGDMLYASGSNTLAKLSIGEEGSYVQTANGIPIQSSPTNVSYFSMDFFDDASVSTQNGGGIDNLNIDSAHPGVINLNTGTNSNGKVSVLFGTLDTNSKNKTISLGGGKITYTQVVYIPTLANVTDDFFSIYGIASQYIYTGFDDGVLFRYDRSTSANWIIGTATGNSQTYVTTSTAVTTGWTKLKFVVTGTSSAEFFINGSSVGTISTNLGTNGIAMVGMIEKTAGTTSVSTSIDYIEYFNILTTPR